MAQSSNKSFEKFGNKSRGKANKRGYDKHDDVRSKRKMKQNKRWQDAV